MTNLQDKYAGCLLGLACGDAVGTTVEFSPRGSFAPLTDMVGGGPFRLEAGQWTDDTSMALCLAHSLVQCQGFDAADQMQRYCDWMNHGYMSSNGRCFDIGITVRNALRAFETTGNPFSGSTDPYSAGNGSIMRLAPVPMAYSPDVTAVLHYTAESSRTTHGASECVEACRLFGVMLHLALTGSSKERILRQTLYQPTLPKIQAIANGDYRHKTESEIRGSGYVADSLEAALFCFVQSDSFDTAVLMAANLGDDADTTAAVCGQLAGAYYGRAGIPAAWLDKLAMRTEIETLALQLWALARDA
ncbi:MAG TPA: ADP-ribosylglycohydrolase family protein [Chloroflexota bacterium]|nr:ADP-ribosylglycohydrolase family protein [Chloroflexota bacterium]HUM70651.1 ADP-ribosylglycohydrolase family protein [Chloroflexota bacterium]